MNTFTITDAYRADVTTYKVELKGAYEGRYKVTRIRSSAGEQYFVFADYHIGPHIHNPDIIELVKETINA